MAVNVYKSIKISDLKNRTTTPVSTNEKAKINQVMVNFIAYLKKTHS
jgi:hypothetical protein